MRGGGNTLLKNPSDCTLFGDVVDVAVGDHGQTTEILLWNANHLGSTGRQLAEDAKLGVKDIIVDFHYPPHNEFIFHLAKKNIIYKSGPAICFSTMFWWFTKCWCEKLRASVNSFLPNVGKKLVISWICHSRGGAAKTHKSSITFTLSTEKTDSEIHQWQFFLGMISSCLSKTAECHGVSVQYRTLGAG